VRPQNIDVSARYQFRRSPHGGALRTMKTGGHLSIGKSDFGMAKCPQRHDAVCAYRLVRNLPIEQH
jgi:hypothetical protein